MQSQAELRQNLTNRAQLKGYPVGYWASFKQWNSVGANVQRGEKGTEIILWKPVTKVVKGEDGQEVKRSFPLLKSWHVFNVAQVEGETVKKYQTSAASTGTRFQDVDRAEFDLAVTATNADIRYGGHQAVYHRPPQDFLVVPHEDQFHSFPSFAETLLHELVHWTEVRTGWTGSYAEGELRAEIGACFLATELGIPNADNLPNHAAYVQNWLGALENDPKFIFRASAAASKAADYILGCSRPEHADSELETAVTVEINDQLQFVSPVVVEARG